MRDLIRDEMEAGAFGVTSCPLGASQERLPTAELIEAARGVGPYCGVYASHIRDEGETGRHLDAIDEVRTVARESGARGHVSHLKLWGHFNWGKTEPVLAIFDRARAEGTALAADQYPYIGGYRGFFSLLWDHQTPEIADPARRRAAEAEVRRQLDLLGGPDRLIVSSHEKDDPLDGKTIGEAGAMLGLAPEAVVPELYLRKPQPRLSAFFLAMHEDDVRVFMASEHTMAGTDSHVRMPGSGASHPRNFGVYPRLLGRYVRDAKIVSLERMVQRMTARVADQFGIKQRGRLERGYFADLVVFNPRTVIDCSTWQDGYRYPEGIVWVLVNGGIEVADEKLVGKGYGRAIRRG
jgi:N-acyl-D-aspartate/D-glutamate deacylase